MARGRPPLCRPGAPLRGQSLLAAEALLLLLSATVIYAAWPRLQGSFTVAPAAQRPARPLAERLAATAAPSRPAAAAPSEPSPSSPPSSSSPPRPSSPPSASSPPRPSSTPSSSSPPSSSTTPRIQAEEAWLLSDVASKVAVATQRLRLYVYDLAGRVANPYAHVDCQRAAAGGGWAYMYRVERLLPAWLQATVEVVPDPRDANVFLVPHDATCYLHHAGLPGSLRERGEVVSQTYLEPLLRAVVEQFPYFNASGGRDHVYVFPHDIGAGIFSDEVVRTTARGIRLQYFGKAPILPSGHRPVYTTRDIVIPQLVPSVPRPASGGTLASQRPALAFFAGAIHPDPAYSKGVRQALQAKYGQDGDARPPAERITVHRGHVRGGGGGGGDGGGGRYVELLGNHAFGLCPAGWVPWSPRVFDVLNAGAVPVVIADGIVEPFEQYLDWCQFALKVASDRIADLRAILLAARENAAALDRMQAIGAQVAPYFQWPHQPAEVPRCKPCGLIALALCERLQLCSLTTQRPLQPFGLTECLL